MGIILELGIWKIWVNNAFVQFLRLISWKNFWIPPLFGKIPGFTGNAELAKSLCENQIFVKFWQGNSTLVNTEILMIV